MKIPVTVLMIVSCFGTSGCGKKESETLQGVTVGDLASNLVQRARTGEMAYFASLLDATVSNQAPQLIEMVKRSGLETNYLGRLRKDSTTQARLDYHDPEAQCHFQVDLQREGASWTVRRVYFCR